MLCGECTLCCSMLKVRMEPVKDYLKPAYTKCEHECQKGCAIYSAKPQACSDFKCVWLASQSMPRSSQMSHRLRPDRCGTVLEFNNQNAVTAHCQTVEDVTCSGELMSWFDSLLSPKFKTGSGLNVLISTPSVCVQLLPDRTLVELVRVGLHPETHNIAYMRRSDYDALSEDVKNTLKSLTAER